MATFVKIVDGKVVDGLVISDDVVGSVFPESERIGLEFLVAHGYEGTWLQTGEGFRKQYASINYIYDAETDEFINPIITEL